MTRRVVTRFLLLLVFCQQGQVAGQAAGDNLSLGTLTFPTSATGAAQEKFVLGILALHNFWFEQARAFFIEAQEADPAFGMAYWGEAMSFNDPLGTVFDSDYESRGEAAVARMQALDDQGMLRWSDKERLWYDAVRERYAPDLTLTERRRNHGRAMESMRERYPEDDEVQVFAALAVMSFPGFDREQAGHVVLAAAPLEEIYERHPDHPGVLHYLIHVYDTPTFAQLAVRQARRYGQVASSAPHAVHMPSHIWKHLGRYDDMLLANVTSWLVSVDWQRATGRPIHMRDFHTFMWLLDTHILSGDTDQATQLMRDLAAMEREIADRGEDPGHFPETAARLRQTYMDASGQPLP